MNIGAAWYLVPGKDDVRWWDGSKFRQIRLIDGKPKPDQMSSATPSTSILIGVLFVLLGLGRIGTASQSDDSFTATIGSIFVAVGILHAVMGLLGRGVERLSPPDPNSPVWDPRTMPWPGQAEQGYIAPGWYAAPIAKMPRWWTGARWSEYLLVKNVPMPVAGYASRARVAVWLVAGIIGVAALAGVAFAVIAADDEPALVAAGVGVAVVMAGLGVVAVIMQSRYVKAYTMPTNPPFMA